MGNKPSKRRILHVNKVTLDSYASRSTTILPRGLAALADLRFHPGLDRTHCRHEEEARLDNPIV